MAGVDTQRVFDHVLTNLARSAPPIPGFRRTKGGICSMYFDQIFSLSLSIYIYMCVCVCVCVCVNILELFSSPTKRPCRGGRFLRIYLL